MKKPLVFQKTRKSLNCFNFIFLFEISGNHTDWLVADTLFRVNETMYPAKVTGGKIRGTNEGSYKCCSFFPSVELQ